MDLSSATAGATELPANRLDGLRVHQRNFVLTFRACRGAIAATWQWIENFDLPAERERGLFDRDNHLQVAEARLELLTRRRRALADRLARARRTTPGRGDRYTRSLFEHRTQTTQRDLEWVDALIAAEGRDDANAPTNPSQEPLDQQGATAS